MNNFVEINIHNHRQGILTKSPKELTIIHDVKIKEGDIIVHPQYSQEVNDEYNAIQIGKIIESRKGRGKYAESPNPTFIRCSYKIASIPVSEFKQWKEDKK